LSLEDKVLRRPVETTTQLGHSTAWTPAAKAHTFALNISGAGLALKRREFITLVGGAAAAWPLAANAQQPDRMLKKLPRIGFLASAPPHPLTQPLFDAFDRGLREHGYVEGQNIEIERRFWRGDGELLAKFAAELVTDNVDLIVAPTTIEALAAKRATNTIPIVTATAGDPVGVGLAASLAHPGGNVTGLSALSDAAFKAFGLLAEAVPEASRFAVLIDPDNPLHEQGLKALRGEAAERHFEVLEAVKRSANDIDPAFMGMVANDVKAALVLSDPVEFQNRGLIIESAARHRIPTAYTWGVEAMEGGLLAYGPDIADLNRRAAGYVAKLLQGAKAGELPIEQAERFRLVINLKTAKALGLTIAPSLLARADEVIE
jgi:putative tryptophan/tyrosine transport system substrate-binding protein